MRYGHELSILQELKNLGARMRDMEANISSLDVKSFPVKNDASKGTSVTSTWDMYDSDGELILPSLDSLKKSMKVSRSKLIRGFIKKEVPWSFHFKR